MTHPMTDLRARLRTKLMVQQAIQKAIKPPTKEQLDSIIAEQLAESAIKAQREARPEDEDFFIWHDGRELPVQSLLLDVLYEFIKKDPNIESMTVTMKDGKELKLSWG